MGKSLRAKTKVRFRGIKREKVFGPVIEARMKRLSENLNKHIVVEEEQPAKDEEVMEVETEAAEPATTSETVKPTSSSKKVMSSYKKKKVLRAAAKRKSTMVFKKGKKN